MSRWFNIGLVCTLLAASSATAAEPPWGTGRSRAEDLRVSLVTFGPGDDIASWFGHSAMLVEDLRLRERRVYNYGMFDFGPTLLAQFLTGRLNFWVGEAGWQSTIYLYRARNRDIRIQELNLTPEDRMRVAAALAKNVLPENRYYLYHHYYDNCATRVRDMIDLGTHGQLHEKTSVPGRMTMREHTRRHTQRNPYIDLLLTFWMNDEIDQQIDVWDEMFLPGEMERVVAGFHYTSADGKEVPLVLRSAPVNIASGRDPVPDRPSRIWPLTLAFGLLLAAAGVAVTRRHYRLRSRGSRVARGLYDAFVGALYGVPGLTLFIMWVFTEHTVTWHNEAILLASPITAALFPLGLLLALGWHRALRWVRWCWLALGATSIAGLVIGTFPGFNQDTHLPMTLMLPANLAVAWAMVRRPAWPKTTLGTPRPASRESTSAAASEAVSGVEAN